MITAEKMIGASVMFSTNTAAAVTELVWVRDQVECKTGPCITLIFILTRGLRQMRGNIGECIIFIIPSYRFFSKLNMFNNTPIIIIDEIGKVKNQQAYTVVVLQPLKASSL